MDAPTLCVFVIITAPSRMPRSRIQVVPVISPFPFSVNQGGEDPPAARTAAGQHRRDPRPDRPLAHHEFPFPRMIVWCPTSIPATSVMAFSGTRTAFEGHSQIPSPGRILAGRGSRPPQQPYGNGGKSGDESLRSVSAGVHEDVSYGAGSLSNNERGAPGARGGRKRSSRNGGCCRSYPSRREATRNRLASNSA